jgi:hypothetical protein
MPLNQGDVRSLLEFFRKMYAHALTLQDLIQTEDDRQYPDVRPQYDQQAEREFAFFFLAIDDPEAFSTAVREFLSAHSTPEKLE